MSENVSSKVLFHFTKSMRALKSILSDGFYPHFCPEYTLDSADKKAASLGQPPTYAIPMVCFCDLPLSLISKHLKEYGDYGIGLDKTWGLKNGVAPVIYTHARAQTRMPVRRLITRATDSKDNIATNDLKVLTAYTKPFRGPAWRKRRVVRQVPFYDEREWRYVPVPHGAESLLLKRQEYKNKLKTKKLQSQFKKQNSLAIQPDVIQYLIVPHHRDEIHVLELHDFVMRLFAPRFGRRDAILVTTAIMTADTIHKNA